ncbi:peptidoglycan editing factor PgeF [Planococcus sp. ISL-110]|uniref:peptidoglycan editing factor PgeF n=1 Tax=Planococcus sp. ISL-110 TaxID=2819167 RepID=UPI001BE5837A|nr:peptidoglycan editing factor PgeF [Planococcus sp. ISL-110]MBT2572186.1 peptidoglycan editing factor PgeF [Planococcus sp. ISL-110]
MKAKLYANNEQYVSGMTLKDVAEPESNNMALHTCENQQTVLANREKLAHFLEVPLADFICTQQTHSANFRRVSLADKGRGAYDADDAFCDTDALYTFDAGAVLCSFAADCVPVIIHDRKTGLIGVVHSGWQGTIKEITPKLLQQLIELEQCDPADLDIQIGAAISQQQFEVDQDVYSKFNALGYASEFMYFNNATKKYHIDNQSTVKRQCELAGVPSGQIRVDKNCTFSSPDGFSYRQDKKSGRHLIFAMKK